MKKRKKKKSRSNFVVYSALNSHLEYKQFFTGNLEADLRYYKQQRWMATRVNLLGV